MRRGARPHGDSLRGAGGSRPADPALLGAALTFARLALSLSLLATPLTARALTQPGALGDAASAVDYYQVTCSDDGAGAPQSLAVQVLDAAPSAAPLVSVQVQKGFLATNTTDAAEGDATPSPQAALNGGAGAYDVFVDKSAAGGESYGLTAQCKTGADGGGANTGTAIAPISVGAPPVPALPPIGVGLLVGLLMSFVAVRSSAHTQTGSLGAGASATDFYQVTCSDDGSGPPGSLALQVQDSTSPGGPLVGVQAQRSAQVTNAVDPASGDASPSPLVAVNGASGVFDVLVYKTGAGASSYSLTYHCYTGPNGSGIHTGSAIVVRQNQ